VKIAIDHAYCGRERLAATANVFIFVCHGLTGYQLKNLDREVHIMRALGERILLEFIVHIWPSG
jgi:hypothetical protein